MHNAEGPGRLNGRVPVKRRVVVSFSLKLEVGDLKLYICRN